MSVNAHSFNNHDLLVSEWVIPAGTPVTEMYDAAGERRSVTGKLNSEIFLDPQAFRVIFPLGGDMIPNHVCFEYTNRVGVKTTVYVHERYVNPKTRTWVDANKQIW